MPKSGSFPRLPFKDYHSQWVDLLRDSLLPRLRRAMHDSSLPHLSTQVDVLRHHLTSYYDVLDLASSSSSSAASILHPGGEWRTPLETPFLWLGDLHPYLFTNLLRSFLDSDNQDQDQDPDPADAAFQLRLRTRFALLNESNELFNRPWHIVTAWRSPSASLMARVEQIECGVRLMVPALMARARKAQSGFVVAVAAERMRTEEVVSKAMEVEMDEMVGVLLDANRLRKSVLTEIVGATSVYQGALFLEALSQFLVGFRDSSFLADFQACKTPLRRITLSRPF